ncbi:MAG: hypothetical protein HYT08_00795 [Candidatus Levybacteria bacterium]|nr:hypothetical protein [Candidatus Levybacteria bacterium]
MDYKKIKKIAEQSFINNKLDPKIVNFVTKKLKRSEIKKYIKILRLLERKKTIYLVLPKVTENQGTDYVLSYLNKTYPDKKIEIEKDPSLISGIKILNDDIIYNYNVKDTINNLISHINKNL